MKKVILLLALACSHAALAADSTLLREIMGKSVYEESGLSELSTEQLKALEDWILDNAVEKRVAKKAPKSNSVTETSTNAKPLSEEVKGDQPASVTEASVRASTTTKEAKPKRGFFGFGKKKKKEESADVEPRYVEISEDSQESEEDEEPVTQKYVRIELLDDDNREIEPDLIRSRIDGTFKGWRNNKTRFKLENGEIWEQRQSSTYITNLDSPQVIIKKRRFGYTMEVPAIGRSVHVKRIK